MTIYFNENKKPSNNPQGAICSIHDNTWMFYSQEENMDKWDIINNVFTDITETPEYKAKKVAEKEVTFAKDFFKVLLSYEEEVIVNEVPTIETKTIDAYIRRKVYVKATDSTDSFLDDSLPLIAIAITEEGLIAGAFIYYDYPDFTVSEPVGHNSPKLTVAQARDFVSQCILQKNKDFRNV